MIITNSAQGVSLVIYIRPWQTRTHCCWWCFLGVQTRATQNKCVSMLRKLGNTFLQPQNVYEQNQKPFLCAVHKICVRKRCCARGQTGKHLCRQQCVLVCQGLYHFISSAPSPDLIAAMLVHRTKDKKMSLLSCETWAMICYCFVLTNMAVLSRDWKPSILHTRICRCIATHPK